MDDSKFNELRHIHRELAQYLTAQNETIIILRRIVGILQQTLDNDSVPQGGHSDLGNRYREYLAFQVTNGNIRPNLTEVQSREEVGSLAKKLTEW